MNDGFKDTKRHILLYYYKKLHMILKGNKKKNSSLYFCSHGHFWWCSILPPKKRINNKPLFEKYSDEHQRNYQTNLSKYIHILYKKKNNVCPKISSNTLLVPSTLHFSSSCNLGIFMLCPYSRNKDNTLLSKFHRYFFL